MWGKREPIKKVSLNDIRSEQLALELSKEQKEEEDNKYDNDIDEDLALALKLSQEMITSESSNNNDNVNDNNENDNDNSNSNDEDIQLALALQLIEEEEAAFLHEEYNLKARLEGSRNPHAHLRKVQSSQWNEALALENELSIISNGAADASNLMFKGGIACMKDGNIVTKHNSLLKSLNNTLQMSAMDYAGDLEGNKLLVNDLGCKSFKTSLQKLNRIDKIKLWKKNGKDKKVNNNHPCTIVGTDINDSNSTNRMFYRDNGDSNDDDNDNYDNDNYDNGNNDNDNNDNNYNDNNDINDNNDNNDNDNDNNDDEDDDDDYYNRLHDAAPSDDYTMENTITNSTINSNKDNNDTSEDSYFDRMSEAVVNDDNVRPENDIIWQTLLRQNVPNDEHLTSSELIHVPYDDYFSSPLLLLEQWAFTKLPLSSAIYRCCSILWGKKMHVNISNNVSSDDSVGAGSIYVDDIKHPLFFMIIKSEYDNEISSTLLHVTLFFGEVLHASDDNDKLFDSITNKIKMLGTKNGLDNKISITFRALDSRLATPLDKSLNKQGFHQIWDSPCELFVLHDFINTNYNNNLPDNYYFSQLCVENDVSIINETWAYNSKTSFNMIKMMIQSFPCIGIKYKDPCSQEEILVSWALTYDYCAIGMLFTLENHRGKGLGQAVIKKLIPMWIKENYGMSPFCYITSENLISKSLFVSIGFQKVCGQLWIGYNNTSK